MNVIVCSTVLLPAIIPVAVIVPYSVIFPVANDAIVLVAMLREVWAEELKVIPVFVLIGVGVKVACVREMVFVKQ